MSEQNESRPEDRHGLPVPVEDGALIERVDKMYERLQAGGHLPADAINAFLELGGNMARADVDFYVASGQFDDLRREHAVQLMDGDLTKTVAENVEEFSGLDQQIAERLVDEGYINPVCDNFRAFGDKPFDTNLVHLLLEARPHSSVAIVGEIERFKDLFHEDDPNQDVFFNHFIEGCNGDVDQYEKLLKYENVRSDPVKLRYVARSLILFPEKYGSLTQFAENLSPEAQEAFSAYEGHVVQIATHLNELKGAEIDNSRPSFGLEIEAQNVDIYAELDTPVTQDLPALLAFVRAYDSAQKAFREDIKDLLPEDRSLVGVYDNMHINIGIPKENAVLALKEDLSRHDGIFALATTVGLLANAIGRTEYLSRGTIWFAKIDGILTVDDDSQPSDSVGLLYDYPAKLQDRYWSFELVQDNAAILEVTLRAFASIIERYGDEEGEGRLATREDVHTAVEDIVAEMKKYADLAKGMEREQGDAPLTYYELMKYSEKLGVWQVEPDRIHGQKFISSDLLHRKEIRKFVMRRLAELISGYEPKKSLLRKTDDILAHAESVLDEGENLDLSVDE